MSFGVNNVNLDLIGDNVLPVRVKYTAGFSIQAPSIYTRSFKVETVGGVPESFKYLEGSSPNLLLTGSDYLDPGSFAGGRMEIELTHEDFCHILTHFRQEFLGATGVSPKAVQGLDQYPWYYSTGSTPVSGFNRSCFIPGYCTLYRYDIYTSE